MSDLEHIIPSTNPVDDLLAYNSVAKRFVYLFESYLRHCSALADYMGTDRSLLTGHDAPLLRQIVRDLSHALLHRHNNI